MKTLIAYHGDPKLKALKIAQMKAHIKADELVHGIDWNGQKGCAVGCTLHKYEHAAYETELGIPWQIAVFEDDIFEGMSLKPSIQFPLNFLKTIPVGADLRPVVSQYLIWLLVDRKEGVINTTDDAEIKKIIRDVAELYERRLEGDESTEKQWQAIGKVAWDFRDARDAWAARDVRVARAERQGAKLLELLANAVPEKEKAR